MFLYEFSARLLDGTDVELSRYRGQVLLLVNVASDCGFTSQYAGLESLQQAHQSEGFTVLGFPCNQFGGQEPGEADAIATFCETNYQVTFPLFAKIDVNGDWADPLWTWLKSARPGVLGSTSIKWNFTKFLVSRTGQPVARYSPQTLPATIEPDIKALL